MSALKGCSDCELTRNSQLHGKILKFIPSKHKCISLKWMRSEDTSRSVRVSGEKGRLASWRQRMQRNEGDEGG